MGIDRIHRRRVGITDPQRPADTITPVAFHDGCHGLRLLGLTNQGRTLVSGIENANVMEMDGCNECCGFGGLFSVKMADVSGAMLQQKMKQIEACSAESILTGDASCLDASAGVSKSKIRQPPVRHIADLLAEAVAGSRLMQIKSNNFIPAAQIGINDAEQAAAVRKGTTGAHNNRLAAVFADGKATVKRCAGKRLPPSDGRQHRPICSNRPKPGCKPTVRLSCGLNRRRSESTRPTSRNAMRSRKRVKARAC